MKKKCIYRNPLTCTEQELKTFIMYAEASRPEGLYAYPPILPFQTEPRDYKNALEFLRKINKKTAKKYSSIKEYILDLVSDKELRKNLEELLNY